MRVVTALLLAGTCLTACTSPVQEADATATSYLRDQVENLTRSVERAAAGAATPDEIAAAIGSGVAEETDSLVEPPLGDGGAASAIEHGQFFTGIETTTRGVRFDVVSVASAADGGGLTYTSQTRYLCATVRVDLAGAARLRDADCPSGVRHDLDASDAKRVSLDDVRTGGS